MGTGLAVNKAEQDGSRELVEVDADQAALAAGWAEVPS